MHGAGALAGVIPDDLLANLLAQPARTDREHRELNPGAGRHLGSESSPGHKLRRSGMASFIRSSQA